MTDERDEFHGQGGSYRVENGKRVRVEESTKDHPEGNRPRDSQGRPLDGLTGLPVGEEPKPAAPLASVKPIGGPRRNGAPED